MLRWVALISPKSLGPPRVTFDTVHILHFQRVRARWPAGFSAFGQGRPSTILNIISLNSSHILVISESI
jgi:hypothetical protein